MALTSQISASFYTSISSKPKLHQSSSTSFAVADISSRTTPGIPRVSFGIGSTFAAGTPLLTRRISLQRKHVSRGGSISIRCEQNANEGTGLDVWLGRVAMVGFAAAISVEVGTGKGLLENFGLTSPLPTVALGVTALVGVLTAIFIFQSASDK